MDVFLCSAGIAVFLERLNVYAALAVVVRLEPEMSLDHEAFIADDRTEPGTVEVVQRKVRIGEKCIIFRNFDLLEGFCLYRFRLCEPLEKVQDEHLLEGVLDDIPVRRLVMVSGQFRDEAVIAVHEEHEIVLDVHHQVAPELHLVVQVEVVADRHGPVDESPPVILADALLEGGDLSAKLSKDELLQLLRENSVNA